MMLNTHSMGAFLLAALFAVASVLPVSLAASPPPYELDAENKTVTVSLGPDPAGNLNSALSYLINRADKNNKWTLKVNGGRYAMTRHMYADKLENVDIVSDPKNPAVIYKAGNYANEYLFYSRFCKNVSIRGFQFYGKTSFQGSLSPVWEDQGLYFGSCNGVNLDRNRFHNFGNAALRITTSEADPVKGINSFNSTVTNNYFNNVFQITTTSNDLIHGATSNYLFKNNNIYNLRGSVKFASRTPGMVNVKAVSNNIIGSSADGFEVDSFSNVELYNNRIENIAKHAINCYTNDRANPGFNWGDNLHIRYNTIRNTYYGIRLSANPYPDGYKPVPTNVRIEYNQIERVTGPQAAISVVNGTVNGLAIYRNKLSDIASRRYFNISSGSQNVSIDYNFVDNAPYLASQ